MVLSRILELKSEKLAVCNVIASLVSFAKKAQSNPTMSCKCLHLLIVFFFFCYCPLSKLGLAHLLSPTTLIIELAKINTAPTRSRVRSQGLRFSYVFPLRNQTLIRHVYRDILFFILYSYSFGITNWVHQIVNGTRICILTYFDKILQLLKLRKIKNKLSAIEF